MGGHRSAARAAEAMSKVEVAAARRRSVPRTDVVLDDARLAPHIARLGRSLVKDAVARSQQDVRDGVLGPDRIVDDVLARLPRSAAGLRAVVNATGVLLHTNLGRAPLSRAAVDAVVEASGTTDVELDLATGRRAKRGRSAMAALAAAVPDAEAVHVVNNGAAALVLAATALAAGREIIVSRGELVEIGDGFRLPDLLVSTGARLREVGTTNRTVADDYAAAVGPDTGFILKVHPSNFVVRGFTSAVGVGDLSGLGVPVVADIGSGLLDRHPVLPDEPDASSTLRAGAHLVTASGDKLLGGPQAGLLLGRKEIVERLRRHPLARALRVDKLTLAALEATLRGPSPFVAEALSLTEADLVVRAEKIVAALRGSDVEACVMESAAAVGGGGAPGVELASVAVSLPAEMAAALRTGEVPVMGRVERDRCMLDLRSVPPEQDELLVHAVLAAWHPVTEGA